MKIVLYEPEIPPNTGNVARLCAACDVELHLIEPLGFKIDDKHLKRAGLDYWDHVRVCRWSSWQEFCRSNNDRLIFATTRGSWPLQHFPFEAGDALVFGPETRGLPGHILEQSPYRVRIPIRKMAEGGVRSLNLSTACGMVLYAAMARTGLLERFS